jgi:MFS family permease
MRRAESDRSHWPATLLLVGAGLVSAMQVGKVPAALQTVQAALDMPLAQAAWLLSAFGVVGAVFGIPIGLAADRFGARRALITGLLLQGIASAAGALAQDATLLIATRVAEGVGFLGAIVAAPALIAHVARGRDAAGPFAAWSTFMPAGMALILLASPWLLSYGWRALWWAGSAAALLGAGAVAWRAPSAPVARGGAGTTAWLRQTLVARGPICLLLLFMLYAAAWFALFGLLPVVLQDGLAPTPARANTLTALAIGAGAAGNLVGGAMAARVARPSSLLAWAFGASAVLALIVAAAPLSPGWRFGLVVAFAVVSGIVPPVLFAEAPAQAPHPAAVGATLGMMMQGNNLGLVTGPTVGAVLTAAGGWPALGAGVATAACTAIALACWLLPRTTLPHDELGSPRSR